METIFLVILLAAVAVGRLYAGVLAADFIDGLPVAERARMRRLAFSA